MTKTRSQQHSAHALVCVRKLKNREPEGSDKEGEGRGWLDSLPGFILVNGLIASLIKLKQDSEKNEVAGILLTELNTRGFDAIALTASDSATYLRDQRMALEYVAWLKRWGQSLLKKKDNGNGKP